MTWFKRKKRKPAELFVGIVWILWLSEFFELSEFSEFSELSELSGCSLSFHHQSLMNELIFSDRITSFRFKTLSFIYFSAFKEMLVIMGDFQVGIQYWNWNKQIYCELELEFE